MTGGVPASTAGFNVGWQRHIQELKATNYFATRNDGGGCYQPDFLCTANDNGSMLFGFGYDGVARNDPKVQAALTIATDTLDEYELMKGSPRSMVFHVGMNEDGTCVIGTTGCDWAVNSGEGGYHYSLWSLTKGLGQYIPPDLSNVSNWYAKVADLLLTQQSTNGSWPVDGRDDFTSIVATSFAVDALGLVGVPTHALTVVRSGNGTVMSSPNGIDCGATCIASFSTGTIVSLTANPATGATFNGWGGACSGTGPCTVTLDQDRSVTATFTGSTTDKTPPACNLSAVLAGPPAQIQVTVRDSDSGLRSVEVTQLDNATATWDNGAHTKISLGGFAPVTPGDTTAHVLTASKLASGASHLDLRVVDMAGNVKNCDPVITSLALTSGTRLQQTFSDIPRAEHFVTIRDGSPGLKKLEIWVNGRVFRMDGLGSNQERSVDVATAMVADKNIITLIGHGMPGESGVVTIADSAGEAVPIHGTSHPPLVLQIDPQGQQVLMTWGNQLDQTEDVADD